MPGADGRGGAVRRDVAERTGGRRGRRGRIIDVSAPLSEETEPWPGDTPVRLAPTARIRDGDAVNLARLTTSLHNGTHADAPAHVVEGADAAERLPLPAFMGPAVVLDGADEVGLDGGALEKAVPRGYRVLVRWGRTDHRAFPEEVTPVPPAWIRRLAERDVPLLGTDAPSLDAVDSRELPAHRACVDEGIQILENLALSHVEPGRYELRALPLRIAGADAAPVRAVLVDEKPGAGSGSGGTTERSPGDGRKEGSG